MSPEEERKITELVLEPVAAQKVHLDPSEARAVSQEMVRAGLVDAHVLRLMEIWGLPTAQPDPETMAEAREHTAQFVERMAELIDREEVSFPAEVILPND